jgi:hypothetical protein
VDGQEESRITGLPGRVIDADISKDQYIENILSESEKNEVIKIEAKIIEEQPKVTYNYSYAKTQAGLTNLLNDLGKKYGDVAISVQELYGYGRASNYNGSQQRISASTYKLVIAYAVAKQIDSSQLSWDSLILGKNVDQCLSLMIVNSNNECAEEFLFNVIGVSTMNSILQSLGMNSSCFGCGYAKSSTNDQIKILNAIIAHNGISTDYANKILGLMSKQLYRKGIPAGTSYSVANKVGFLEGYLNDSAIIYTENGPLLISIYTNKLNWSDISVITEAIIKNCT